MPALWRCDAVLSGDTLGFGNRPGMEGPLALLHLPANKNRYLNEDQQYAYGISGFSSEQELEGPLQSSIIRNG
jgi:hypothetical protein